jgi:microcompartment protein CcmL/EutN
MVAPPALGVLEVSSIVRGLTVVDAMLKRATVRVVRADPVTPGKMLIAISGGEAEVEESLEAVHFEAAAETIDRLFLPGVHAAILPALDGVSAPPIEHALGALEMRSACATLLAADASLKAADVALVALHLARGIDGKGYVVFTGSQDMVEAALDAGDAAVLPERRAGRELIARPHPDVDDALRRL